MLNQRNAFRRSFEIMLVSLLSITVVLPGQAAEEAPPGAVAIPNNTATPVVSQNVTINLINRLVERGVLTKQDAADLLLLAEADAAEARAQTALTQAALAQAAVAEFRAQALAAQAARVSVGPANAKAVPTPLPVSPVAVVAVPLPTPLPTVTPPVPDEPLPPDTVRVSYVPEVVKKQLREEIKQDVMAQAREENWAAPRAIPGWVNRFSLFGDIRMRYEGILFPSGNDTGLGSSFWNFNAINTASTPYDYTGAAGAPYTDVDQDRHRVRLRARLGAALDLSEGFTGGLRLGTGENNSPVTQNQTLGAAGAGQGGDFSKYALWLDRAFIRYEIGGQPDNDLSISVGRFDNPFFSTSMIWADDIGFDGLAAKWKFAAGDSLTPFVTVGVFPVFNTDLNFGTTNPNKTKSYDKWLYAAQLGTDLELNNEINFKIGAAYYFFDNVEGRVSTPFTPYTAQDVGNTDASRPAFAQRGNTYIALRDILLDTSNSSGSAVTNQWQYFGLATPFHEFAVTAQLDYSHFAPFQFSLFGEYVRNLAFDRGAVSRNGPASLPGPVNNNSSNGSTFGGGGTGWKAGLKLGRPALEKRWDWNITLNYRQVDSDAVVDGFCDADFGGGGTNFKGFTIVANLAIARRVWLGAVWMSATQIAGPVFNNDTAQFDINTKF
jgi:hypothetical protein